MPWRNWVIRARYRHVQRFVAGTSRSFSIQRQVLFDRLAGFTPVPTSQEAFNYFKSLEEPFDATNDAITTLGRVDFGPRAAFSHSVSS